MNPNELQERQAAADAICSRVEDIVIIRNIPEYWPDHAGRVIWSYGRPSDDPFLNDLRAAVDVI